MRERPWLCFVLAMMRDLDRRVFETDADRMAFDALPSRITIYRGTVQAERPKWGISWTLDRDHAIWFATTHGRFRNTQSPPIILQSEIHKLDATGFLTDHNEAEILVTPDVFRVRRRPRAFVSETPL